MGMRWPWGVGRSKKRGNGLRWAGTLPCHCDRRDERENVAGVGETGDVVGVGESVRTSAFSALDGRRLSLRWRTNWSHSRAERGAIGGSRQGDCSGLHCVPTQLLCCATHPQDLRM